MSDQLSRHYFEDSLREFRSLKEQADKAMSQLSTQSFFFKLDEESNSIAVLVKHIAGNLRSRWTDFLHSDGEKPERDRDREFEIEEEDTSQALLAKWEAGWNLVFETMESLKSEDPMRVVRIRARDHTLVEAIHRQLTHNAAHIGQIVLLAKHLRGDEWETLTIPRGQSEEFNVRMMGANWKKGR